MKFKLINPIISGEFVDTFEAENPKDAAKKFWEELTIKQKIITNNVPQFAFSLESNEEENNEDNKKLFHFVVKETPSDDGKFTDYTIEEVELKDDKKLDEFKKEVERVKKSLAKRVTQAQKGGRRKRYDKDEDNESPKKLNDDGDDDDDDEYDDLFRRIKLRNMLRPFSFVWYAPTIYTPMCKTCTLSIPTFTYPVYPYFNIWIPH